MLFTRIKNMVVGICLLALPAFVQAYEVLDLPATHSDRAATSQLFGIAKAGDRLVAVGIRGHILLSDDGGHTWRQAQNVPVRSDLLSADFINAEEGWAVGHDSVILHTTDGGENWEKQFDGMNLGTSGLAYYGKKIEEAEAAMADCEDVVDDASEELLKNCKLMEARLENLLILQGEMAFAAEQGADKPFFGVVCYGSACNAGGAYGLNYRSLDSGKTWLPVLENMENPEFGHLFDVETIDDNRSIIGGEMGSVWIADRSTAVPTWTYHKLNYEGSIFSVEVAADGSLLAGGLRGNLFRSTDNAETWEPVKKPNTGSLVDSVRLQDGRIVYISQTGQVIVSSDNGASFSMVDVPQRFGFVSLVEFSPGVLVVVGNQGSTILDLNKQ